MIGVLHIARLRHVRLGKCTTVTCALVLCLAVIWPVPTALGSEPPPSVRALDDPAGDLLQAGMQASPLFRELVERLAQSDLVVFVQCDAGLPRQVDGRLSFIGAARGARYANVSVNCWKHHPRPRMIAALGHELYHAVEIAEAPWVIDLDSLGLYFGEIGFVTRQLGTYLSFETSAATEAGRRIAREVRDAMAVG